MRIIVLLTVCTVVRAAEQPSLPRRASTPPPALPLPSVSPKVDFRRLLMLPADEREKILNTCLDKDRQVLQAGLKRFDALPPDEREKRVRALQLQVHLRRLIRVPASNRVDYLEAIPEPDRQLVADRLGAWDQVPADLQREFLENELAISALTHPEFAVPRGGVAAGLSPQKQAAVEAAIGRWLKLPEEKRQQITEHFQRIFQLDNPARSLGMNEVERGQMERTLLAFRALDPTQRAACVAGLRRFTQLSAEERNEFLRNVELWQQMSPQERKLWRALVAKFRPPKPPLPLPVSPFPKLPGPQPTTLLTTNGN